MSSLMLLVLLELLQVRVDMAMTLVTPLSSRVHDVLDSLGAQVVPW